MTPLEVGIVGFAALTVLIYLGLHISSALLLVSFVGIALIRDNWVMAGKLLAQTATDAVTDYDFGTAPLFVLMGFMVMAAGVGKDSYTLAERLFGRMRGGIGHATVMGNAVFSAVTGVSIAAVVMFTRIAVPEMLRRGYPPRLAVGIVAGSAMLGMLIPPSVLMIIFAVITETSIGDLYNAGILPGLVLAFAFMVTIAFVVRRHPQINDRLDETLSAQRMSGLQLARLALPTLALIVLVLGGMYAGFFTATEAGAVGAAGGILVALMRRALTRKSFWRILIDTGYVTSSIVLIIASAAMFTRFLAISGLPSWLAQWIAANQFSLTVVMLVYVAIVLALGTALDSVSTVLIAVPVFAPVFAAMGADLVWVGVITMIAVEVGIITPPLGISPFIVKSTLNADGLGGRISLADIYAGALPFAASALVVIGVLLAFPQLALVMK